MSESIEETQLNIYCTTLGHGSLGSWVLGLGPVTGFGGTPVWAGGRRGATGSWVLGSARGLGLGAAVLGLGAAGDRTFGSFRERSLAQFLDTFGPFSRRLSVHAHQDSMIRYSCHLRSRPTRAGAAAPAASAVWI